MYWNLDSFTGCIKKTLHHCYKDENLTITKRAL